MKIICPHCGEEMELNNKAYSVVASQVRTAEFDSELHRLVALETQKMKQYYENEIARYKDFKLQMSVKDIGENLEHYTESEVRKVLPYMFPSAKFSKDNDQSKGSKGDFIFRDYQDDNEILSVMIECKDEADISKNKKKNNDHFSKLDKDRNQKNCEYAILVSMLERDNELYNRGITEIPSNEFTKMYVVRPQYLLQLLGLLSNMAKDKSNLVEIISKLKAQQSATDEFADNLDKHKEKFARNHALSHGNVTTAIQKLNTTISELEDVRDRLIISQGQAETAANVVSGLTVRKVIKKKTQNIKK